MSASLNILKQLLVDKGGYSAQPLSKNLIEVKNSINNMMNYRNGTNCPTHAASQYTGKLSLGNLKDYADANLKGCQCNAKQFTTCTCDSRTACDCQGRSGVSACACNNNCNCNGECNHYRDTEYVPCDCMLRVLGTTMYDNMCNCNSRTSVCYCENRTPTCNCNGQSVVGCTCNGRTTSYCNCDYVTGPAFEIFCDCESRTGVSACNCNVRTGVCDGVATCQCNTKEVFA